jgi:hypothetical protein
MSIPKLLCDAVGKPLKRHGFKKKRGDTWYRDNQDTISVFNLQKSSYGPQYYVNIAIWLKQLGDVQTPQEQHCHIRLRWESIIPEKVENLQNLMDFSDSLGNEADRELRISKVINDYITPYYEITSSLSGVKEIYGTPSLPSYVVVAKARQLIEGN